jgi:hypothetical protein
MTENRSDLELRALAALDQILRFDSECSGNAVEPAD